ncbi:MAG: peptide ABC transporter substrate-binding protein [Chloroflexi bacterium]|nr:peptide ABC transporter substrate-binding protein [Chloroflexota bacterium]
MERQGDGARERGRDGEAERRTYLLSLVSVLGLLVAACGLADLPPPPQVPGLPTPEVSAGEQTQPGPGGAIERSAKPAPRPPVLRMPITEPGVLDPGTATDPMALDLLDALFEPLVVVDESGQVQPGNAERWQVGPGGATYLFTLREGLRWSDGTPLTAQDYVWAWRRNVTPATGAGYASLLYPIRNAREIHAGRLDPSALGARAVDDRSLEVTLAEPGAAFLSRASTWVYLPLSRQVIERQGTNWADPASLVGNGPYRISAWSRGREAVLEPNPVYTGLRPARLERIELKVFAPDAEAAVLQAYEAGDLDTTSSHFQLPGTALGRIRELPELARQLVSFDLAATSFVVANHRKPYLQDARVRRALGMALDRAELVAEALGTSAGPAWSLGPSGNRGQASARWPGEDAAEAQRLLAQAGYPEGKAFPPLRFTYRAGPANERVAQYLQRRWREVLGITLRPEAKDERAFIAWQRTGAWEREGDLYRASWSSEVDAPGEDYRALWSAQGDAALLRSGWRNQQFDALLQQAAGELDPQRRTALYTEAERVLAEDYPSIPLYQYRGQALVKPYVHGFSPRPVLGLTPWPSLEVGQE